MSDTQPDRPIDFGARATESPDESNRSELDAVGDVPDTGDLTPPDSAQDESDSDSPADDPSAALLSARLPFGVDPS